MQDYNTIIGSIQMRLNNCPTRSVMDRYNIGSGTLNLIMSRYKASGIPIEELTKGCGRIILSFKKSSTEGCSTSRFSVLL